MILLDTHVSIWWLQNKNIAVASKKEIKGAKQKNDIYLSSISGWKRAVLFKYERCV